MNFKVYLLRVKLSSLEVYHTNICHRVFHVLALGPLTSEHYTVNS